MKTPEPLSPLGTATASLREDGYPVELRRALRDRDLGDGMLLFAWELSRIPEGLSAAERRATVLLLLAVLASAREGSTRLPIGDGAADLLRSLGATQVDEGTIAALLSGRRLDALVGGPDDYKPLILEEGHLYLHRLRACEERLAAALAPRIRPVEAAPEALAALRLRPPMPGGRPIVLSAEQERAVLRALASPFTIVTGGPGTGKTAIVMTILRALARQGAPMESVALAAPTGRAAQRLRESIVTGLLALPERDAADERVLATCPEARTLHRLLGYSPATGTFRHHENHRLPERVIIVDEASMIDLYLMERLARSLRDDARLVLLGDADQLPSVEAGAVLRDLVQASESTVRLTRSYRMDPSDPAGRHILAVATAIHEGMPERLIGGETALRQRASAEDLAFEGAEWIEADGGRREAFLARWWEERVRPDAERRRLIARTWRLGDGGFDPDDAREIEGLLAQMERARLLCVTRGHSATGAEGVNALLHAWAERDAGERAAVLPGAPLLMLRNDYDREIYNGDVAVALRVAGGDGRATLAAVFRRADGIAAFPLDSLRSALALCWATTVHKSQGAEMDFVGLLLPDEAIPLLTRELLYTAVTRSRRSAVVCGNRDVLVAAVARRLRRSSGVAERLARRTRR